MSELIRLYCHKDFTYKYSKFASLSPMNRRVILDKLKLKDNLFVDILAFCIMPTHIHLILKQNLDGGIGIFLSKVLNSYSKYFNTKHQRTGPLWSSRFHAVLVIDDEQLYHLSRYVHLNPTSAGLVDNPENWDYSSYNEYLTESSENKICNFNNYISLNSTQYKEFVESRINYQKELSLIKYLTIDDYSG